MCPKRVLVTRRSYIISILFFLFLFILKTEVKPQFSQLGKGWAQNSVNAVIFRKNSLVYHAGEQYTAYYDSTGTIILAKRKFGDSNWILRRTQYSGNTNDAHCSISIMIDGKGYLHMAWGQHDNQLNYCRSISPGELTLGEKLNMTEDKEDKVSYPEFYRFPNGDLLFMYRYGQSGSGNLILNKYSIEEKNWSRLQTNLIDGEEQRNAYWQACIDHNGVIHISWVWRESWDVATNHDICYAQSADGGKTWQKSSNEKYRIPITQSTAEVACFVPMNSELINQTSMYADLKSRPYIVSYWRSGSVESPQYQLVYLLNGNWKRKQISNRKTNFSLTGGGTKKIPISRPQLVVDDRAGRLKVYMIYRDTDRDNRISMNFCRDISDSKWYTCDLNDFSVNSWEPTYDSELWKKENILSIFVQNVGQGEAETLENISPQPVYILDVRTIPNPAESFITVDFN